MKYKIRDMQESDWEKVSAVYKEGLAEGRSTFQKECPSYEAWDKSHLKDCRYVIMDNNKIIGWCSLSATSAREVYKGVVEVSIYISSEFRNKGAGTELLNFLIEETEKKGYWSLYSAILEVNSPSILLHKKCGFREIGYREKIAKDIFGVWQNTILMERRSRKII